MRKFLMVLVVALMAATGFAAPAQAAPVDRPFGMAYGNSTASGKIHFTDGYTAGVSGVLHAASSPRQLCAQGMNGNTSSGRPLCSAWINEGENATLSGSVRIPVAGGVQQVIITMYGAYHDMLVWVVCTRDVCTRRS
ncbi:hypothetical protein [Streptomyces sp. NPDC048442]|uniref:hypothetical protein n=1 Tax=Streptomyces sp. NPDC048442 TaxID=3154823 RepID=UPI0034120640